MYTDGLPCDRIDRGCEESRGFTLRDGAARVGKDGGEGDAVRVPFNVAAGWVSDADVGAAVGLQAARCGVRLEA